MPESPIATLTRWEDSGAVWRLRSLAPTGAVVDLLTCGGEPVDVLRSDDPELRRYLELRPSSELEPPSG